MEGDVTLILPNKKVSRSNGQQHRQEAARDNKLSRPGRLKLGDSEPLEVVGGAADADET
ncbi:hypothetical protein BCR35DRAFT_300471 [Leucosporidium creatinivorum]|uniref:Uncharacterized protein n=1 Tax=Leucosporidium creatinivorum TaxID=106004 RepID=A0A1Y2G1D9_9BASI|nr:hypothetical protein BCR35DRAFT_300471 [Leucosporidium creatinivorum]